MKNLLFAFLCLFSFSGFAQQFELHYDFRHTVDPKMQSKNFPTLFFEYFKSKEIGSTLLKIQTDFKGNKGNIGQCFIQLSQTIKFWKPKIYLNVGYSGGLGIIESIKGGFYINNSYALGAAYPFLGKNSWYSAVLCYRYSAFEKPSHDTQFTFYVGKGIRNYKFITSASLVCWTENRNHGDDYTKNLSGKKLAFFGDPQIWYNVGKGFSAGSKIWLYYHVLTPENTIQAYPTLAVKYKFE
ncbi:DUF5020 family protein [Runella sp.]|uniref:DUF5020 family protein n=1 Tax=Runella sp. TaxID=1960881 RepID=UPI003D0D7679